MTAAPAAPFAVDGFYADRQGSMVDAVRRAARDRAVAPYEAFVRLVQRQADAFATRQDRAEADCALDSLASWARAGILTGALSSPQAEYERNWYLAGLALAYLKLMTVADGDRRTAIETWLGRLAGSTEGALDRGVIPANNLSYWAGLALAAAGLATGNPEREARATRVLRDGLAAVGPDGTLPQELRRGEKALDYHAFAAAPLATLALVESARGRPFDREALRHLSERVMAGVGDPAFFAGRAGAAQVAPAAWNLAWLGIYRTVVPGEGPMPAHATASHFLGGDVEATIAAIRQTAGRRP
ncbi:MAG: alginate lyase family protein [Rhizobiales bacterium]|nr:alginate lyase family protein [Hyphomicrobiales bacterium]